MSRQIVVDGDPLKFESLFPPRTVTPSAPAKINGSGHATINGKSICVKGDEAKVKVPATYEYGAFKGGQGNITIKELASDQIASDCISGAKILIKGKKYTALFTYTVPAKDPKGNPDPSPPDSEGKGSFEVIQNFVTAG